MISQVLMASTSVQQQSAKAVWPRRLATAARTRLIGLAVLLILVVVAVGLGSHATTPAVAPGSRPAAGFVNVVPMPIAAPTPTKLLQPVSMPSAQPEPMATALAY
jgi:hypothetical protein